MEEDTRQRLAEIRAILAEVLEVDILTLQTLSGFLEDVAAKVPLKAKVASDIHTALELWSRDLATLRAIAVRLSQVQL